MLAIPNSTINIIVKWGGPIWPFNEHNNLHFEYKKDMCMSSKNYDANGYKYNFDLVIISHLFRVSLMRREKHMDKG